MDRFSDGGRLGGGRASDWGLDHYVITDLNSYFEPSGINNEGQVVGDEGSYAAVLWSGGITTVLPGLGAGYLTSAYAINDSGQVVGASGPGEFAPHAFVYANGTTTDLGTLGGSASKAVGINSSGQIVGSSLIASDAAVHAFLYSNGTMTDLGTAGGMSESNAVGISDSGQVAAAAFDILNMPGASPFPPRVAVSGWPAASTWSTGLFFYNNGTTTVPNPWPRRVNLVATAVSRDGRLTGSETWFVPVMPTGMDVFSGEFLFGSGGLTTFGVSAEYTSPLTGNEGGLPYATATAHGVNSAGEVVGVTGYPFVYADGAMADLNSLIALGSGWTLQYAGAINDRGWIAGLGVNPSGQQTAYILKPASPGDANLDGRVDINDLTAALTNYGNTAATWAMGDFNNDGRVDINDLTMMFDNYGTGSGVGLAAVPEPAGFVLLGGSAVALAGCAWRRLARVARCA